MSETLSPELLSALATAAATDHLLVALDFDGTMSPLVDRAEDARALPGSTAALRELAQIPRTTTALISGRALDSLRLVASPEPETLLIGSHGAETWTGPDGAPLELTESQASILRRATAAVQDVVDAHPGTVLELKPAGVVLHTRTADQGTGKAATAAARDALASLEDLHLSDGKNVLELSVVQADKGRGLQSLRELTNATAVIFAGDDVTDEHAFKTLKAPDVGIKVGEGETAALYRITSPEQLVHVLQELVTFRRAGASA
ncbi:trehalose 6-phosphate phosphatase [Arthrobacter pigmenti]|uniref:Trehalose 6-phosphate phosphatase n=1 Tax=Arthrobacter pigmenti TaxID=271432 RepID=A0A846RMB5_9MICC|nr:trehalose-phosphatase [Arthrobacter pigmenti]NJC21277.1 trehalose 6-phosphate phosphatase [Arthrobacter pigmenti]